MEDVGGRNLNSSNGNRVGGRWMDWSSSRRDKWRTF